MKSPPAFSRRYNARLAAVQALYQGQIHPQTFQETFSEFLVYRSTLEEKRSRPRPFDPDLCETIVSGVGVNQDQINTLIRNHLDDKIRFERLETLLLSILQASCFELVYQKDIPPAVIINEYTTIAWSFFDRHEPAMINAILDSIHHNHSRKENSEEPT